MIILEKAASYHHESRALSQKRVFTPPHIHSLLLSSSLHVFLWGWSLWIFFIQQLHIRHHGWLESSTSTLNYQQSADRCTCFWLCYGTSSFIHSMKKNTCFRSQSAPNRICRLSQKVLIIFFRFGHCCSDSSSLFYLFLRQIDIRHEAAAVEKNGGQRRYNIIGWEKRREIHITMWGRRIEQIYSSAMKNQHFLVKEILHTVSSAIIKAK